MRASMIATCLGMVVFAVAATVRAGEAPEPAGSQTATFRVGQWTVHAVSDAQQAPFPSSVLLNVPAAAAPLIPEKQILLDINAYLLRGRGRTILVDTGTGGRLHENLAALGVKPESVDTILLTHLHSDHTDGLLVAGKPAFPKAAIFVAEKEKAYWFDDAAMQKTPADWHAQFTNAREKLKPYGDRVKPFTEADWTDDLRTVALPGHTPGHTGFMLASGGESLLIWGDIIHYLPVQIPYPETTLAFDGDQPRAAATRRDVLERAAGENRLVAGMHLPFPGVGRVAKDGTGFQFLPLATR